MFRQNKTSAARGFTNSSQLGRSQNLEYPTRLNFYNTPPLCEVNIEEFETFALDRLQVLKAVETAYIRNRPEEEVKQILNEISKKCLPLSHSTAAATTPFDQERRKDHISHFILRLAFCRSEELRNWFLRQECALFKLRFSTESIQDKSRFLEAAGLQLKMLTPEDKRLFQKELYQASAHILNFESEPFFEVDFEKVPDLIQRRQVYVRKGKAYVPMSDQAALVVNEFKNHLSQALEATAKALPRMDEDERLLPVLTNLSKQYNGREYTAQGISGQITSADVDNLTQHFPLCMKHLNAKLKEDGHLKHGGRMQYGLFLKGIGLSLEEALHYWRTSFYKMSDDQFQKGYAYNIRHNYGMEGRRTDYTPYSCMKIITGNSPSSGDHHGCPFRHFSPENLRHACYSSGATDHEVNEILELVRANHFQVACTRYFELTHKKVTIASKIDTIIHPNQYFDQSYDASLVANGKEPRTTRSWKQAVKQEKTEAM
ncbi:DNA primase large subunit Spp2 [Basidiobolus meristosporus CBS 931.73]|uniref:DNA primase large subunit n=1 Tax=Basidiobolus meristosporus CBS 931.73 TaxID=1314790 RepID=A0A1Y1Z909_9FUNG|nr:DNA primase large subunit Spp2 [Basidiobolus meristosporus CBS 931.73]|eukprot:ORY06696.1 DNA primase large subunit Spp2 [Basidiobolus meristosporus CBS 931.73]